MSYEAKLLTLTSNPKFNFVFSLSLLLRKKKKEMRQPGFEPGKFRRRWELETWYLPDCAKPGLTERVGQFVLGINWNNRVFLESCLRIVVVILRKNSFCYVLLACKTNSYKVINLCLTDIISHPTSLRPLASGLNLRIPITLRNFYHQTIWYRSDLEIFYHQSLNLLLLLNIVIKTSISKPPQHSYQNIIL